MASDDSVDALLEQIKKAAELELGVTQQAMDNHLLHSDRVIGNLALLKTLEDDSLLKAALANPTS